MPLAHEAWSGGAEVDFSASMVPHVREASPGAGRPGGAPFDDLFEVVGTGDPVFPRCVRAAGLAAVAGYGELELSAIHSYMPRYKSESTCVGYEQGARLLWSAPIVQRLKAEGLMTLGDPGERVRLLVAAMLEQDLGCVLSPADNAHAFYVDPRKGSPTAVKRILHGGCVGYSILQSLELYPYANPLLQDHLPPSVRFAENGVLGTGREQDDLRKLLYQVPRYFVVVGNRWPSAGRMVTASMTDVYRAAVAAGWTPGQLLILRQLIESGARLSEIVALTILDLIEGSDFGTRSTAINKGSRGRTGKELGWTPACGMDGVTFINDHRHSPAEVARYGRRLKVDDFRELYAAGRHDELRVPVVATRLSANYTRDGYYNHVFAPTMGPLGVRGHDPRHAFVSRNLDLIYGRWWADEVMLKAATDQLVEYMAWSAGELMLFLYSKRHRQRREALLSAAFHTVIQFDEASAALAPGRTPVPAFCAPNRVDAEFDEWMAAA